MASAFEIYPLVDFSSCKTTYCKIGFCKLNIFCCKSYSASNRFSFIPFLSSVLEISYFDLKIYWINVSVKFELISLPNWLATFWIAFLTSFYYIKDFSDLSNDCMIVDKTGSYTTQI